MSNLVGRTNSYASPDGPPQHPPEVIDDERLPLPSGAPGPAADAASCRQEHTLLAKRMLGASRSLSALSAPPERRRNNKRQKTTKAREDLCCFCSIAASCSSRNCLCAKAGRPCQCCDPGTCDRCTNTVAAHNQAIRTENTRQTMSIASHFWQHVGRPLDPLIPPLYDAPPPPAAGNDEIDLTEVERNNPSGDAEEYDDDPVIYFDTLMALLDLDDFVEDNDNDDALSPSLGLSANGSNAVALTTLGRSANGVEAPPALAAPLGFPTDLSDSLGDNNALGTGPGILNGTPVGDGTTGVNGALGSPVNGNVAPLALS
jgi:hypothetical protein